MADLWTRAAESLTDADQQLSHVPEESRTQRLLQDILGEIEKQSQRCLKRRWKIRSLNGRELIVRDLCAKIVNSINHFSQVGDAAMQWDPGHAAIPWAIFRFVLQVGQLGTGVILARGFFNTNRFMYQLCTNDIEAFEAMLEGLEKISGIICRGKIMEELYLFESGGNRDLKAFREALLKLYRSVLEYLTAARKYFEGNSAGKLSFVLE